MRGASSSYSVGVRASPLRLQEAKEAKHGDYFRPNILFSLPFFSLLP
jgi:hypothetical protein